ARRGAWAASSSSSTPRSARGMNRSRFRSACSRTARGGRSTNATSLPTAWRGSLAASGSSTRAGGSSPCARDAQALVVPVAALAAARRARLQGVCRGGLSARVAPGRPWPRGTACVHPRPGARLGRGRGAAAVAWTRGPYTAALAGDGRGGVLRHLLLRLGHALLPRALAGRPRRPDADAARAGAVRLLARVGAAAASARADRYRGRP